MLDRVVKASAQAAVAAVVASVTAYRQVRDFFGARKEAPFR